MEVMGALPPYPRNLALFFSRMEVFLLFRFEKCRIMQWLDRRIGHRRNATRAPNQARNRMAAFEPPLAHAAPSKRRPNFVQPLGSTSVT
jgi:hypothetical protein